jgi:hypothetical protein
MLVTCFTLVYSLTLKIQETCPSETSVYLRRITQRYIPEHRTLHNHRWESLRSYIYERIFCGMEWYRLGPYKMKWPACRELYRNLHMKTRTHLQRKCHIGEKKVSDKSCRGHWRPYVKVKLSLCLTNWALHHEGVWGSGCIDPHFFGRPYVGYIIFPWSPTDFQIIKCDRYVVQWHIFNFEDLLNHFKICLGNRDSSVGIATGYGLDDRGVGVRVAVGSRIFSTSSRPALGSIQPPIPRVPGVKLQGREAEHSPTQLVPRSRKYGCIHTLSWRSA